MKFAAAIETCGLLLATGCTIGPAATGRTSASPVILDVEAIVDAADTPMPNLYRLALPPGMPDEVVAQLRGQLLSSFGREDLVASKNDEYATTACAAVVPGALGEAAVLDAIAQRAARTSILIVNESHYVSRQRAFIADLLERLRPLGYSVYAAETFRNVPDGPAPIEQGAALPYPRYGDGNYTSEPAFGRLVRTAKALGYRMVAYEQVSAAATDLSVDQVTRMNDREIAQTDNLARFLRQAPVGTKVVIHVVYSHASEQIGGEVEWLAARLKRATGIDPLSIGQADCRGGAESVRMVEGATKGASGTFDLNLDHPLTTFDHARPAWRFASGDIAVPIPAELRPTAGAVIVEARLAGEPDEAVPIDRVYVAPGDDVVLALPPGHYRLRAVRTEI